VIPGGTYYRDPANSLYQAQVSSFRLDIYEVTIGRFRKFLAAYQGPPPAGAGKSKDSNDQGWNTAWNSEADLASASTLVARLTDTTKCSVPSYWTSALWTVSPGTRETDPMNCMTWYVAFAFCVWDGGRLPTEAEWQYAAANGASGLTYPWGSVTPDPSHVVYDCDANDATNCPDPANTPGPVGSKPNGKGAFGQLDLAGSLFEWTRDSYVDPYPATCTDCAVLTGDNGPPCGAETCGSPPNRVIRGGSFRQSAMYLTSDARNKALSYTYNDIGVRCARNP
jgi:formylglycine-generating enzyme required for sulfatase activity